MNSLIQFHIDHHYYVHIKPIAGTIGFTAHFPANIFHKMSSLDRTYIVCNDGEDIEIFDRVDFKQSKSRNFTVTKFSMRVLILQDVLLQTLARKMSQRLIVVDKEAYENIFEILKVDLTPDEALLEKELCIKFRELILGRIDRNIKDDLAASYDMLIKCFEKGGL